MYTVQRDVIDGKRAEAVLEMCKKSEQRYRELVENANSIMLTMDMSGRINFFNEFAQRFFGYRKEEILGKNVVGTIVPPYESTGRDLKQLIVDIAINPDAHANNVNENMLHNGERVWIAWTNKAIYDGNGKPVEILCVGNDITELKRAEDALHATQLKLSDAMDLARIAYWEVDPETNEFIFNNPFYSLYGTSAEREGGYRMSREEYCRRFVHPDDVHIFEQVAKQRLAHRGREFQSDVEHRIVRRDGEVRHILVRVHQSRDARGRIIRYHGANQDITARKHAESQLLESEERYRVAIESSNDGVVLFRGPGLIYANRRLLDIFGYESPEEALSTDRFLKIHPDDREMVAEYTAKRQKNEPAPPLYECRGIGKNGETIYLEVSVTGVTYLGQPASLAYLRDITERVEAEKALQESEKRLRSLFNAVHETMVVIDGEGTVLLSNIVGAERLGKSVQELIGTSLYDCFPPDVAEYRKEQYNKVIASGEPVYFEDKREGRYYEHYCRPLFDEGRKLRAVTIFAHDITERRKAGEALERSEEKYHSIFNNAIEGIFQTTPEGRYLTVNRALARMYGYSSPEEMIETITDVQEQQYVIPKDRVRLKALYRQQGFVEKFETQVYTKNRNKVWISMNARAVKDREGNTLYYEGSAQNITDRKNLEAQLVQAQKMEAIGTLAGGVAHDFNNILAVIMGLGNLIQMSLGPDDRNRPYVDQIVASAEKAADLTQSLLAFSRKQRINLEPHHLSGIVQGTAKLLKRLLPEDIGLKLDLADDCVVLLDVSQIDQVLMNLATNARDAMPKGGLLTISIQDVALDDEFAKIHGFGRPGRYAMLSVSDTGTGMSAETMSRIFEPFFTTKEVGKGTGLGLSSVYGIVKQHNGYITVTSAPGEGTTFNIYLPLTDMTTRSETVENVAIDRGEETILVIEDDADVRKMITTILLNQGYTVLEAADGEEAIRVFNEHKDVIHLIIADIVMPGKTGQEVLNEIIGADPSVKGIFISGYTGDTVLEKGVQKETVDFLYKPVSVLRLLATVRAVLDRQAEEVHSRLGGENESTE
jgi:PAS domain S-box-containing protein